MAFYFVSDTHIGLTLNGVTVDSEKRLIEWLDEISADADAIFLLGDIFDFWFEYKRVVPKGHVRLLGKLAELTDKGVKIHFFPGNHDMWVSGYFEQECGVKIHARGEYTELAGYRVYLGHGDGLGRCGLSVTLMQRVFRSRTARKLFSALVHPNLAMKFGNWWSRSNRLKHKEAYVFRGEDEGMVQFARSFMGQHPVDYFIFGHLHCPTVYPLGDDTTLYVLGDWISPQNPVYGVLDAGGFRLEAFPKG